MSDDFQSVITELWRALRLPPSSVNPGQAMLTFDNIPIELSASSDGRHIQISGQAGTLSDNPALMAEQVSHILKANLRALPFSHACVCLVRESPTAAPKVVVRAYSPCQTAFMDRLAESIGDVLHSIEEHAQELTRYTSGAARQPSLGKEIFRDAIILRP